MTTRHLLLDGEGEKAPPPGQGGKPWENVTERLYRMTSAYFTGKKRPAGGGGGSGVALYQRQGPHPPQLTPLWEC